MSKKLAVGAIIGAVAGVVAGVLTAPKSGKEVRADIAKKAKELKTKAHGKLESAEDKIVETVEDTKNKAKRL